MSEEMKEETWGMRKRRKKTLTFAPSKMRDLCSVLLECLMVLTWLILFYFMRKICFFNSYIEREIGLELRICLPVNLDLDQREPLTLMYK